MNKQREAFEKWCEENGEVVTIEGRKCYPKKEWEIWQAAIASQEATINTLNAAITEDKILAVINAKLQAEIDRLINNVDLLRGQLQNCVNHLEGVQRRNPNEFMLNTITSANNCLYRCLYKDSIDKDNNNE
jgi:uncharacterized coiled-coil protein SlyX